MARATKFRRSTKKRKKKRRQSKKVCRLTVDRVVHIDYKDVALLKRSLFGPRRERFENPDQRLLFDFTEVGESSDEVGNEEDAPPEDPDDSPPSSRRQGRGRRVIPECLPRVERFRELDDEDIPEELRGQPGRRFFKKAGEWIEWQPSKLFVVEEYVEVLAIDNEDATETAMITGVLLVSWTV